MIDGVEVVRNARAKVMRLSVDPATGRVRLTVPNRMALAKAVAWAREQADWIAAQRAVLPEGRPFVDGAVVPVEGRAVRLVWDAGAARVVRLVDRHRPTDAYPRAGGGPESQAQMLALPDPGPPPARGYGPDETMLVCGGPAESFAARIERWLRREALHVLTDDTAHYAAKAGVTVAQVAVADPRARWGSCSSTGAIRYSWRLLLAPVDVRRATVAHEVAHRIHMHHGPDFHALVATLFEGDPGAARRWLRTHGAQLHWYGRGSSS